MARLDDRPILVLPTGAGKTHCAVEIIKRFDSRVLFLAHRRELIAQAAEHLSRHDLLCGIIQAGYPERRALPIQVASVQTLARRQDPVAGLIIIDEAHHVRAATYSRILDRFPSALRLGLTATPARLDGRGLGAIFGCIIVGATARQLCNDGTLIAPIIYAPPAEDMSGVRVIAGDFDMEQAARRYDRPKLIGSIVDTWLKHGSGRTIAFAINILHSQHIVERFQEAGVTAEHLDGSVSVIDRMRSLKRWRSGETMLISNCGLFGEGFDLPALQTAIIARPTASLVWHLQSIGRVMRAADGKDGAVVLDHAGNTHRHGMVTDDREWSLDDKHKPKQISPGITTCPKCYLVCPTHCRNCPECGHEFITHTTVLPNEAKGELVKIEPFWQDVTNRTSTSADDNKKRFWASAYYEAALIRADRKISEYASFLMLARKRNYKDGWAAYAFKNRYGRWPNRQEKAG